MKRLLQEKVGTKEFYRLNSPVHSPWGQRKVVVVHWFFWWCNVSFLITKKLKMLIIVYRLYVTQTIENISIIKHKQKPSTRGMDQIW